jgi:hypothetical protein
MRFSPRACAGFFSFLSKAIKAPDEKKARREGGLKSNSF